MEITCSRCHQTVQAENCYCAVCGLPQLVYAADGAPGQAQPERGDSVVRDASCIDWKPALRAALLVAIPAGVLSSGFPLVGFFGLAWMAVAGAWAVVIYVRSQKSAWITLGAGARIGMVTGLLGSWTAAATMSAMFFAMRFFFHQGKTIDDFWQSQVSEKVQQWTAAGMDAKSILVAQSMLNAPEGRAGLTFSVIAMLALLLVAFATAGGALGARLMARRRQPEL